MLRSKVRSLHCEKCIQDALMRFPLSIMCLSEGPIDISILNINLAFVVHYENLERS